MTRDFTIACGNDQYIVDLDIVAPCSEYFRRAPKFGKEASEGIVTLHDDEPATVSLMIEYLHEGDYNTTSWKLDANAKDLSWIRSYGSSPYASCESIHGTDVHSSNSTVSSASPTQSTLKVGDTSPISSKKRKLQTLQNERLDQTVQKRPRIHDSMAKGSGRALYHTPTPRHMLLHIQLWEVADKYLVPGLQALCTKRWKEAAEYYHSHPEMSDAILFVYEDLPEHATDLREAIVSVVVEHLELLEDEGVRESLSCQELCEAVASRGESRTEWVSTFRRDVWPYVS
jgi:hypothetical protein